MTLAVAPVTLILPTTPHGSSLPTCGYLLWTPFTTGSVRYLPLRGLLYLGFTVRVYYPLCIANHIYYIARLPDYLWTLTYDYTLLWLRF